MSRQDPPLFSRLRAAQAYQAFTGHKPTGATRRRLDTGPVAGYRMGEVVGIAYKARRDGKTAQYFHRFKKRVRPDLVSRSDGKQLYISGGKYKVTDRGIEDMSELFVINPSRRKGRKRRAAAKRRTPRGQFMRNPRRRRRSRSVSRRRRAVTVYQRNPRRRRTRRHSARRSLVSFRRNPIRRRRRRSVGVRRRRGFLRNPIGGSGSIFSLVVPALFVGAGAVGTELAMGYLPIPAAWKTGPAKYAVKGGVAIAIGWALAKFFGARKLGEAFAVGGVAIAAHDAIRAWMTGTMPNVQLGAYNWRKYNYPIPLAQGHQSLGYYSPGATMPVGMGAYVRPRQFRPVAGGSRFRV